MATTLEINTCLQPTIQRAIKIEILDKNENIINEISGMVIDGNISIDTQSAIRRQCDLRFVLNSTTVISETSSLWINKRFRLYIGIINNLTNEIVWYLQGTFLIFDPTEDIEIDECTVSIKGYDKMAILDGTLSGQLDAKTIIEIDTPISEAITSVVTGLGGETKYLIDTSPYNVPYKIEKDVGNMVWDILEELRDLYMTYKCYYDVNSIFRFMKIKDGANDPVVFNFDNYNVIKNLSLDIKYSNVRNYFKIIGRLNSDGTQYLSEKTITNVLYPNSLFTVEKMGETRKYIESKDNLFTQEQVDDYCDYMIYKHLTLSESISLTCIPLLFLDVDQLITINYYDIYSGINIEGNYLIDTISVDLAYDGLMNLTGHRVY